ncbi:hypothetical protein SYNPS1DRAFT_29373 [Syncephalis pseudoplumigaleata]|uniref:Uncharacterized protein n=1 Tax=Syncephalis pseudoplumigaleata TaxID=1712513 RepID=A0A4P9YZ66_9FUNG|nr:hypothetical protein SYNPS1DRAFT_29373 [Syncephalis pseudoplumigaleata]|eukprot:RKP24882.1 hypothetical protein SYNPS1DRAFT_29373 [Syncephalis pseudoplumigaleata]
MYAMTQSVPRADPCPFHQVLATTPHGQLFQRHIAALYGLAVEEEEEDGPVPKASTVKTFSDCEYHTYQLPATSSGQHGIATVVYCFDRDARTSELSLGAIHLTGSSMPMRQFALPGNIELSMTGRQVVAALGEPERKGGPTSSASGVWMAWDRTGIQVELSAIDWEHPDATIREIILYRPAV